MSDPTEPTGMEITLVPPREGFGASCFTSPLFLVLNHSEQSRGPSVKHCTASLMSAVRAKESNFAGLRAFLKLQNQYFANLRLK